MLENGKRTGATRKGRLQCDVFQGICSFQGTKKKKEKLREGKNAILNGLWALDRSTAAANQDHWEPFPETVLDGLWTDQSLQQIKTIESRFHRLCWKIRKMDLHWDKSCAEWIVESLVRAKILRYGVAMKWVDKFGRQVNPKHHQQNTLPKGGPRGLLLAVWPSIVLKVPSGDRHTRKLPKRFLARSGELTVVEA